MGGGPLRLRERLRRTAIALATAVRSAVRSPADDDDVAQVLHVAANRIQIAGERFMDDQNTCVAVVQKVLVVVRLEERVDWNRDRADLDRAEEPGDERGAVGQKQHDALATLHAKIAQRIPGPVDQLEDLRVG